MIERRSAAYSRAGVAGLVKDIADILRHAGCGIRIDNPVAVEVFRIENPVFVRVLIQPADLHHARGIGGTGIEVGYLKILDAGEVHRAAIPYPRRDGGKIPSRVKIEHQRYLRPHAHRGAHDMTHRNIEWAALDLVWDERRDVVQPLQEEGILSIPIVIIIQLLPDDAPGGPRGRYPFPFIQ